MNGKEVGGAMAGEYLAIRRRWAENDRIDLNFDMAARMLKANPSVTEDRGRVAFQRGPIVFCMEHLDQEGPEHGMDLAGYTIQLGAQTASMFEAKLLDGVMVLEHPGAVRRAAKHKDLYFSAGPNEKAEETPTTLKLIPYYAWANRAPASMQVWIPYTSA